MIPAANEVFAHVIVIDGRIAGTWKVVAKAGVGTVDARPYRVMTREETRLLTRAAERYGRFLDMPIELSTSGARP